MIHFIGNQGMLPCCNSAVIADVMAWCYKDPHKKVIGVDTETEGLNWHSKKVIMLQIGDEQDQFVIDTRFVDITPLKTILEDERIVKVLQNAKFDYKFLLSNFGIRMNNIYDTLLAECLLTCGQKGVPKGLADLTRRYLDIELSKETRGEFHLIQNGTPFTESQITYGARDVEHLPLIRQFQMQAIASWDLEYVLDLENRATVAFAEIENNGIKLDRDKWIGLATNAEDRLEEKEEELDHIVLTNNELLKFKSPGVQLGMFGVKEKHTTVLWSSPSQVQEVLQTLDPSIQSTGVRELFKRQGQHKLFKSLIDYRKEAKLVTTYGKDFIKYIKNETGRVHTIFWQILNTGRVSSGAKGGRYNEDYPNMQNIPALDAYRNCFVAEDGWKIVSFDFSGQELRLIAEGSHDPLWIKTFNEGGDVHGEVAAMVFDIEVADVRNKPDFLRGKSYRDVAKTINFGLAYGMSEHKLADTLDIPVEDAKSFIDKYFAALPKIKKFLEALGNYGKKHKHIRTFKPSRRVRFFADDVELSQMDRKEMFRALGEIERQSKNTPIQGTGADMIKLALAKIVEYIRKNDLWDKVRLITQVHDEIGCEVKEEYVDKWLPVQQRLMEEAGAEFVKSMPMTVDASVSDVWKK